MKKFILFVVMLSVLMVGCSIRSQETRSNQIWNVETSYFDNYACSQSPTAYHAEGTIHQATDHNGIVAWIQAEEDCTIEINGTMQEKRGNLQLVYIAPDGTETLITENTNNAIDTTITVLAGEGTIQFKGENAVYDFQLQFSLNDSVRYNAEKVKTEQEDVTLEMEALGEPTVQAEDWSEKNKRILTKVYGDNFKMAYSMDGINGTTDEDNFLCDFSKLNLQLESNCVLLSQETGDGTERTIQYEIKVLSGQCAIMYDNESGDSTTIWSGNGQANGSTTITLDDGANCLRLQALDKNTELKIKLQCTK